MTPKEIKEHIVINERVEDILKELGCHHIRTMTNKRGRKFYACGFPDGDNIGAINIFCDNLKVKSYTRDIKDEYGNEDIFALTMYIRNEYFFNSLKWLCEILGLDYYSSEDYNIPESLQILNILKDMKDNIEFEDDGKVKPINESILKTYFPYCNKLFLKDGIDYLTQKEFEIGVDLQSERITIPIRDELGTLVGVKGRWYQRECPSYVDKYLYLESCSKSKICFGLNKTIDYIVAKDECIIGEAEKFPMQLWSADIKNTTGIGGHELSKWQVEKIIRTGVSNVVLCYDGDVARKEDGTIDMSFYEAEANKFIRGINVYAMIDFKGELLKGKKSPSDNIEVYKKMYKERMLIRSGE